MRFDRFTIRGQEAVQEAIGVAEKNQNQQVEPEHILAAMLDQKEGVVRPILGKIGANPAGKCRESSRRESAQSGRIARSVLQRPCRHR